MQGLQAPDWARPVGAGPRSGGARPGNPARASPAPSVRFAVAACSAWASAALIILKFAASDSITADESTLSLAPRMAGSLEDLERYESIPSHVFDPNN